MSTMLTRPTAILIFSLVFLNLYLFHRLIRQPVVPISPTIVPTPSPAAAEIQEIHLPPQQPTQITTTTTEDPTTLFPTTTLATITTHTTTSISTSTSTTTYLHKTHTHPQPQPTSHSIPHKLWQKTGTKGLTSQAESWISTWTTLNPHLRHEILTETSSLAYVETNFRPIWPEIADLYTSLSVPILRADLLRLLILYIDGGIWSDLDVSCEVPISQWPIPSTANVVVGIEFDGWQFASWTVMSTAGNGHIYHAIEYVAGRLEGLARENNVTVGEVTMEMIPDVVDVTGPQAITVALLETISEEVGRGVGKEEIEGIGEGGVLLGDVLVLPQASFAALQGGMPQGQGEYLVSHHYAGSWKNEVGGEEGVKEDDGGEEQDGEEEVVIVVEGDGDENEGKEERSE
ncbi:alpha-1,6-mannosyltransferase Och1 [Aspergillus luchuensis]|uniref:Alpha-1,6-mannosyltransferase Och1 n=2 Tax=Aspergillus kawachii TaxID=1069201 RepID=A0A146FQJ5_ASPKA|nr:alpha-1,6-mannosyltransferase Och1 [Aspergillus luchuensis]